MQALAASSAALLREAWQLSADASAVMSEVLIRVDGVAGSAAEIFATLLSLAEREYSNPRNALIGSIQQ